MAVAGAKLPYMILVYWLWLIGTRLAAMAPPTFARPIARRIGLLFYSLSSTHRRVMRENLAHVLRCPIGNPTVDRVARQALGNYAEYLYQMLTYSRAGAGEVGERVILEIPVAVQQVLSAKGPIILVTGHFGPMDLAGAAVAQKFRPITFAAEVFKPV